MSLDAALLVLVAAVIHASWNAMLRSGVDRLWTMTVMCVVSGVCGFVGIFFTPAPLPASWPFIAGSACLHVLYYLLLVLAYRHSGLVSVYPIARGTAPLLVTIGAVVVASEIPSTLATIGIVLVSGGVISLAFRGKQAVGLSPTTLAAAIGTGVTIACYSVTDGLGVRLSGNSFAYTAWLFALDALSMPIIFVLMRGARWPDVETWQTVKAVIGGVISLIGYGVVIWAASLNAMGPVSALRETSVVFAALIGRFALGEALTPRRLASCVVIAIGAICLGYR